MRKLLLMLLIFVAATGAAHAVEPGERLADPVLEARAREISRELRCLVCQNQSIDDSNADLAADLRRIVRERLAAGDSNAEVLDYIVERYGEFVLMKPPFSPATWLLWGTPILILALGGLSAALLFRGRNRSKAVQDLSAEEEKRLDALLNKPD